MAVEDPSVEKPPPVPPHVEERDRSFFGEKKIAWFGFQSEFQLRIMRRADRPATDRPSDERHRPCRR